MYREVESVNGVHYQVRAVPTGAPLRVTNTPGTGIVDNLLWTAYLELREATARRWKVGVVLPQRLAGDRIVTVRKLQHGEDREAAVSDLIEQCRRGDFDKNAGAT
ncbi:hypothetical protein KMZ30_19080 [Phycicoccus sp. KQZ13P-1]|uniref:hypothetical protein n=1 Tax=Phycicoccus mangrovi TaxID=2840470 RepID=UPI001C008D82|nr:hypothetical protein [Phycicoccus mangrovi]MBT9257682.1 hypothetical protein [Phycicoccus mangrovi]